MSLETLLFQIINIFLFYTYIYIFITEIGNDFFPQRCMFHIDVAWIVEDIQKFSKYFVFFYTQ